MCIAIYNLSREIFTTIEGKVWSCMLWQVKLPNVGSAFNELILGFTNVPCAGVFTCQYPLYTTFAILYIYICFSTIRPNHRTRKIIKPKVGSYKEKFSINFFLKKARKKKRKMFHKVKLWSPLDSKVFESNNRKQR